MSRRSTCRWLALVVAAFAVAPGLASNAPIYKCLDNHLGVVYTDLPCKDGEQLDIRAGDADPAAVARIERERDRLDESAAQRMLDERRAAERWAWAWLPPAPQEDRSTQQAFAGPLDYGFMFYPTYLRRPPLRPRPQPPAPSRFAAAPPRFAPDPPRFGPAPPRFAPAAPYSIPQF